MRLLTPTENRRLNELIGFLGIALAVLLALALLSYSPRDASFNVSAQTPELHPARNWIGPAGAYTADLMFQILGYAAFVLPMGIFALGIRWFRSRPLDSAVAAIIGYALWILSLPALLSLWGIPEVRNAIPPGGFLGGSIASWLENAFNPVGAHVVALASLFAALFLTTPFSFMGTHALLRGPVKKLDPIGRLKARWSAWRERREQERLRKRVEANKLSGRAPVPAQTSGLKERKLAAERAEDAAERAEDEAGAIAKNVLVLPEIAAPAPPAKRSAGEPKIARGVTGFRLPSTTLLRPAERSEKIPDCAKMHISLTPPDNSKLAMLTPCTATSGRSRRPTSGRRRRRLTASRRRSSRRSPTSWRRSSPSAPSRPSRSTTPRRCSRDTWRVFGWHRVVFPNTPTSASTSSAITSLPIPTWDRRSLWAVRLLRLGVRARQPAHPGRRAVRQRHAAVRAPRLPAGDRVRADPRQPRQPGAGLAAGRRGGAAAVDPLAGAGRDPRGDRQFDYRYVLVAVPFACLAAAMAFSPARGRRAARGE